LTLESTNLKDFLYDLPQDCIARHPLATRDGAKLLIYQNEKITHEKFKNVIAFVPKDALLFLNNTRVIAARLFFFKETGAKIEVFLTDPVEPYTDFQQAFKAKNRCVWKCIIGNVKKWKDDQLIHLQTRLSSQSFAVAARLLDRENGLVEFRWPGGAEFLDIIETAGHVPLPPYLHREDEQEDKVRYQTVFSEREGAVAAPTAGLHFTNDILQDLRAKGVVQDQLTLHVSAGTFRPIKAENFEDHPMHQEIIIISRRNVQHIFDAKGPIIAVGTTALRTLESMYWFGARLSVDTHAPFQITKADPYLAELQNVSVSKAMHSILKRMDEKKVNELHGSTGIFIYPGYRFKIVTGLFTNFHMPGSTLILLVAAFVGGRWKDIYHEALEKDYRFLSYGDTSLLLR